MKVLVTGGAGFIGSHTTVRLVEMGYDVVILDNLNPKVHPAGEPVDLPEGAHFIRGDVRDRSAVEEALDDVDVIFHFAAYQDYMPDFSTFFEVNSVGTALIYEVLVEKGITPERIVIASSQAVYGEGTYRCEEHGAFQPSIRSLEDLDGGRWEHRCPSCGRPVDPVWVGEDDVNPLNPYAMSKRTQEMIGLNLGARYEIPTVAMRYSIVQGPRQSFANLYSGVCRIFCLNALRGRPSTIYEDGQQLRDYVNVDDVVEANLLVMHDERAISQVFNVGGDSGYTVLEFAEMVSMVMGEEIELLIPGKYRFGDTRHVLSNTTKLKELGWNPTRSPRKSVTDYLNWLREIDLEGEAGDGIFEHMTRAGVVRETSRSRDRAAKISPDSAFNTRYSSRQATDFPSSTTISSSGRG